MRARREPPLEVSAAQRAALEHVRATARRERGAALARLRAVAEIPDLAVLVANVGRHGRVTLNFHPDRLLADGRTIAAAIGEDGRYRSQFETRVSNGARTAFPGGSRDRWEERLFGGAYHAPGVGGAERPKYGGLNLVNHPDGASPRFGSCHVRLRPEVNRRCTYCYGDSHDDPRDVGTIDAFECVLAGLLEGAAGSGYTLGVPEIDPIELLRHLPRRPVGVIPGAPPGRALDDYIEAQVHGPVDLAADAEAIVVDPSFRGTPSGRLLEDIARRCGIGLEWHAGFELAVEAVPADFRGPVMPPLAARIGREYAGPGGRLDAEVLGRAAASVVTTPERWAEWGSADEMLQYVKQLWHVLVRFGAPRAAGGPGGPGVAAASKERRSR